MDITYLIKLGTLLSGPRSRIEGLLYRANKKSHRLVPWKDCLQGQPMLVVGNGPSLNQTPLDDFAHVPSIGMNKIDLLFPRTKWRPSLICCTNDIVVRQHWAAWQNLEIPIFLSWKTRWHIPSSQRSSFGYFLNLPTPDFSPDAARGLGWGHTVTYAALQLAFFMGANPVVLFGVDHSFVQEKGTSGDYERRVGPDVNHFDPNYFAAGTLWGLANLEGNERDYMRAKLGFEASKRSILDATVNGKLEVFPKISLDEARSIFAQSGSQNLGRKNLP